MTRKKILLVIVEGPSDETALGYAMTCGDGLPLEQ
jgi:hypothetical protein